MAIWLRPAVDAGQPDAAPAANPSQVLQAAGELLGRYLASSLREHEVRLQALEARVLGPIDGRDSA
jgi:hypothetical protein